MTFQDFRPISFFCTVKHYKAQGAYYPDILESSLGSHGIEWNGTRELTFLNSLELSMEFIALNYTILIVLSRNSIHHDVATP